MTEQPTAAGRVWRASQFDEIECGDTRVQHAPEVCRRIEAHLDEPLAPESLGEPFRLSPFHLQRTFGQVAGIGPQQYAKACRMGQVKAALYNSHDIRG